MELFACLEATLALMSRGPQNGSTWVTLYLMCRGNLVGCRMSLPFASALAVNRYNYRQIVNSSTKSVANLRSTWGHCTMTHAAVPAWQIITPRTPRSHYHLCNKQKAARTALCHQESLPWRIQQLLRTFIAGHIYCMGLLVAHLPSNAT